MRELDRRIATLRLKLAEINARQDELRSQQRQFRNQMEKLMEFAIFERADLDSALSMADEVDSRLGASERALQHLDAIKARGKEELEALMLTKSIDEAKSALAALETRQQELGDEIARIEAGGSGAASDAAAPESARIARLRMEHAEVGTDIKRLRHVIAEASDEAARAVSAQRGRMM